VSPLDGRYASAAAPLRDYFSEYALIKYDSPLIRYRIKVEIEWLKFLY